ncbi:GIY-YIG nuclease family protein [Pseudanabaenaceae cyanobacterium LEGE 13415]|nr:GIY-YIG nuclease family protein [Pseudanabaenaceae cyanobacterium LEGE 13415]
MEWQTWQHLPLKERSRLPSCSGIYVVADINDFVWYVGQAANLRIRWTGKGHHRYPQLIRSYRKLSHQIYWKLCPVDQLDIQERYYIERFAPELNGCKVKTYLPKNTKQSVVDRELKRLLRILSRQTLLFPIIRSIVAGEFHDEAGTRHIVILTSQNDYMILANSARKRSRQIKSAWDSCKIYSGRDEETYYPQTIPVYTTTGYTIEFVEAVEILRFLEENLDVYERCVGSIELFGVQMRMLLDLSILDMVLIEEEYSFVIDGKKTLKDGAYLNYVKHRLKPLEGI